VVGYTVLVRMRKGELTSFGHIARTLKNRQDYFKCTVTATDVNYSPLI
jgi:hypothetical protein